MSTNKEPVERANLKAIVSDYAAEKVINWALKRETQMGKISSFKWSKSDQDLLSNALFNSNKKDNDLPIDDPKFRLFFETVIKNGLNNDDVVLFQKYKDYLPLRALGLAYNLSDFSIEKNKFVSHRLIDAGFYMLELKISPKIFNSRLPVVVRSTVSTGQTDHQFFLNAHSSLMAKRLIKLEQPAIIQIDSSSHFKFSEVNHLKLAKLTRNFFVSRIYKKLGQNFNLNKSEQLSDRELEKLWVNYERIFSINRVDMKNEYHDLIIKSEQESIPRLSGQLRNLIRWTKK